MIKSQVIERRVVQKWLKEVIVQKGGERGRWNLEVALTQAVLTFSTWVRVLREILKHFQKLKTAEDNEIKKKKKLKTKQQKWVKND